MRNPLLLQLFTYLSHIPAIGVPGVCTRKRCEVGTEAKGAIIPHPEKILLIEP